MRKVSVTFVGLVSIFLVSCGGGEAPQSTGKAPVSMVKDADNAPEKKELKKEVVVEEPASEGYTAGLEVYNSNCKACHQATGMGIASVFPPLAKADFLADKEATIKQVLYGSEGEMVVNGMIYNGAMTPFNSLSDDQIADVLNYIYNSWGNTPVEFTSEEVTALR